MKNKIKFLVSFFFVIIYFFIAIASGSDKIQWEQNNAEIFCGKEFQHSDYLEQISMDIHNTTILNCDGTYESKRGWKAIGGEETIQGYRTTVGRSSDEEYSFKGTWKIIKPNDRLKGDRSFEKYNPTYINFNCSNGNNGFGMIYCTDYKSNGIYEIRLIILDDNGDIIWDENEYKSGIFSGHINSHDIENNIRK